MLRYGRDKKKGPLGQIIDASVALRRRVGIYSTNDMALAIAVMEREQVGRQEVTRRSTIITSDNFEVIDKVVMQPYNFMLLEAYAENHPFLTIIHGAIIRSVIKNGWCSRAKWIQKCKKCGTKYKEPVSECTTEVNGKKCGRKTFRAPDWDQRQRLDAFIQDPNLDDEMKDIIESLMKHLLATANAYFEIVPLVKSEVAIYVENSANMFIAASKKGRLGNGDWYCDRCFGVANKGQWKKVYDKPGTCELCSDKLTETAYLHKEKWGGDVDARFGRDDIVHFNSNPKLPSLYGAPKIVSLLLQLRSATAMMRFNFNNYAMSRMAMIIALEGSSPEEANKLAAAVQQQEIDLNTQASFARRLGMFKQRVLRLLFLGSKKGLTVHNAMPDSRSMQSLEWMDWWFVKMVAAQYGCQPVYINVPASGGGGGYFQRMQVVVHAETTAHYQAILMKPINEELLDRMGITDWEFAFNPIEPKDEREDAQIWSAKIAAGQAATNAGLDAELNDDGELKISGTFKFNPDASEHATHTDNLPETPGEPRQPGDESITPGADQGEKKKFIAAIRILLRKMEKEVSD